MKNKGKQERPSSDTRGNASETILQKLKEHFRESFGIST